MIKLSRTGWNNVIIFSVMAFILLINVTQNRYIRNDSDSQSTSISIIGDYNIILSLTINQQTNIERIGQTWRALPANIQDQPLEAMMSAWHQAAGQLINKPEIIDKSKAVVVSLILAGNSADEYLMLLPTEHELIIFKQSTEQWLSLPLAIFYQLVPNEVVM